MGTAATEARRDGGTPLTMQRSFGARAGVAVPRLSCGEDGTSPVGGAGSVRAVQAGGSGGGSEAGPVATADHPGALYVG